MLHQLKTWAEFFGPVLAGQKTFEIRRNDRNFRPGDILVLQEFLPDKSAFTGRECRRIVTYVTDFAQQPGFVVMGLAPEAAPASAAPAGNVSDPLILPLNLAFIRWSVVHRRWHETANDMPLLEAFLAGWCGRCIGMGLPENVGTYRASFLAGWREADDQVTIARRQTPGS